MSWISVNDSLPNTNGSHIACLEDKTVCEFEFYRCPEYNNSNWSCPVTGDDIEVKVTHWQKMPEPVK